MASYVVTFTNENYADSGLGLTANVTVPVDLGVEVTPDTLDEHVERLCELAVELWNVEVADGTDWDSDEPGWEVVTVTLPDGTVVDL